jgi:predicted RNA polymerase sigma factor
LLLLVVGGLLAWYLLTRGSDKTTVPDVTGLQQPAAEQRIRDKHLDPLSRTGRSSQPLGVLFAQVPGAACHARASDAADTDWARIAGLYAQLAREAPSPVVELNRAVAVAMADGPAAGLVLVDALRSEPALRRYYLLPCVRGDLLVRLGRHAEARGEFLRAASLTRNDRERGLLLDRAAACPAP